MAALEKVNLKANLKVNLDTSDALKKINELNLAVNEYCKASKKLDKAAKNAAESMRVFERFAEPLPIINHLD